MAPITAYIGAMAGGQAAHSKHLSTSLSRSRAQGQPRSQKRSHSHGTQAHALTTIFPRKNARHFRRVCVRQYVTALYRALR